MLAEHLRVLYLHGFASSPGSRKAVFFAEKLRSRGFEVDIPDLAGGNFGELTISGQLEVIERLADHQPSILIGSSMGGYLASLYAARHPEVDRLVLLAPAFAFYRLWLNQVPPADLLLWEQSGAIDFYHYGEGRSKRLHYGLLEDAKNYEEFPAVSQPTLIFHGENDRSVPIQHSIDFANTHPNARLVRFSSGHELTDVMEDMWKYIEGFLPASGTRIEC